MDRIWLTLLNDQSRRNVIRYADPNMIYYRDRILSFENWPVQSKQNKHAMACASFYYTKSGDIVKCFSCGLRLG